MINTSNAKSSEIATAPEMELRVNVHEITPDQLQRLGLSQVAYVKPVFLNGTTMFAIHSADGSPMALAEDQSLALAAIVQHEMIPALVH